MSEQILRRIIVQRPDYATVVNVNLVANESGLQLNAEADTPGLVEALGLPWSISWDLLLKVRERVTG